MIHETLLEPHSLVVVDMDGDGDLDAATCAYGDRQALWFENDGRGGLQVTWWPQIRRPMTSGPSIWIWTAIWTCSLPDS